MFRCPLKLKWTILTHVRTGISTTKSHSHSSRTHAQPLIWGFRLGCHKNHSFSKMKKCICVCLSVCLTDGVCVVCMCSCIYLRSSLLALMASLWLLLQEHSSSYTSVPLMTTVKYTRARIPMYGRCTYISVYVTVLYSQKSANNKRAWIMIKATKYKRYVKVDSNMCTWVCVVLGCMCEKVRVF